MLNVKVIVSHNAIVNEKIAHAHLVNQQTMSFDSFCDYIAGDGSMVTSSDVSAVMKRLEKMLPMLLSLNTKIIASPLGLAFRSAVKGSLTQSELTAKLTARKAELLAAGDTEAAAAIDVNRAIVPGDLTVAELTPYIEVVMPDKWSVNLQQLAEFKRVSNTTNVEDADEEEDNPGGGSGSGSGSGDNTGGNNPGSGTGGGGNDDLPMGS